MKKVKKKKEIKKYNYNTNRIVGKKKWNKWKIEKNVMKKVREEKKA